MNRIIIDTDTGIDDAQALLLAFAHKDTIIEAITSVSGNVDVTKTTANILKVLDVVKQDVPVYPGCALPLVSPPFHAAYVHGKDGLGDAGIPVSKRKPERKHAVNALIDLANANPGELSIIAIGPLTNIAVATMLDPEFPAKIKELTIMGGAVTGKGNTHVNAEFNIFFDPEAAHVIFDRWPMVRVLDWETTLAHGLSIANLDTLFNIDSPKADFFKKITSKTIIFLKEHFHKDMLFIPDGLAVAAAIDPSIIKRKEIHHLTVELRGDESRGLTIVDWFGMGGKKPNAEIVMEIDQPRFFEMIKNGLS
ncbi:MAG: nucleoside hydrolase [Anaerolineaceae bacterium]|nr:nucleoside hydrolase [Anaerolineaceae bacterium]